MFRLGVVVRGHGRSLTLLIDPDHTGVSSEEHSAQTEYRKRLADNAANLFLPRFMHFCLSAEEDHAITNIQLQ